jgi:acyl-CoA synthetase (AMP-forming)/AMP-acid ligase II
MTSHTDTTIAGALRQRAQEQPDKLLYRYLVDGDDQEQLITYGELDTKARAIASVLAEHAAPGDRVLLLYEPGLEFVAAFYACLYAGLIAVPAWPPDPARLARTLPRLRSMVKDCQADVVATSSLIFGFFPMVAEQAPDLRELTWVTTDTIREELPGWTPPRMSEDTIAFLQYTSGSTGNPKGVVLTNGCLVANGSQIRQTMRLGSGVHSCSWLPVYHDMGLIGHVLQPMWIRSAGTLMSHLAFLQRPMRWLRMVSKYRANISCAPNFAYELCVRKATPDEIAALDLRSWKVAVCGSEKVRAETVDAFVDAFAPCGFQRSAFLPVYGLAESTLFVSGGGTPEPIEELVDGDGIEHDRIARSGNPAAPGRCRRVVSCGEAGPEQEILVVDPDACAVRADGEVGEIWVRGPNVASGYWQKPEESEAVFGGRLADGSGPYLRTGDLGYLRGGQLFVTGRLKDLIILNGRNYHPEDIERVVEKASPALRPGSSAAFCIEREGREVLVVVAEVERRIGDRRKLDAAATGASSERRGQADRREVPVLPAVAPGEAPDMESLRADVRRAVVESFLLRVEEVELLRAGTIPKTSSGKVQRFACRKLLLEDGLEKVS